MKDIKNSIFENNIRLLSRNNNHLAAALQTHKAQSAVRIFPAKNGLLTAEAGIPPNCTKLIHSAINPLEDARQWAQMQKTDGDFFVLLGMGLGYPAQALLEKGLPGRLLIIEKDMGVLKLATTHCNLTGILENDKVILFTSNKVNDLRAHFQKEKTNNLTYGIYHPATVLHPDFYEKIRQYLDNIIYEQRKAHAPQTCSVLEEALKELMI